MIDPHTHQYMERMKDEPVFLALASKASAYLEGRGEVRSQARIALRRVEHFYYKTEPVYEAMRRLTIAQQQQQAQAQESAAQQVGFFVWCTVSGLDGSCMAAVAAAVRDMAWNGMESI